MRAHLAVCVALFAVPVAAADPPALSFELEAVVARGISPRGQAVWFSVAREISRQSINVVPRYEIVTDEDGDGAVRLELGKEVPLRSIWFAVDLATGETGVATPEAVGRLPTTRISTAWDTTGRPCFRAASTPATVPRKSPTTTPPGEPIRAASRC